MLLSILLSGCSGKSGTASNSDEKVMASSLDEYYASGAIYPRYSQWEGDVDLFSFNVYSDDITKADMENIALLEYEAVKVQSSGDTDFHQYEGKFSFIFFDGDSDEVIDKFMAQEGKRLDESDDDIYLSATEKYKTVIIDGTESKPDP